MDFKITENQLSKLVLEGPNDRFTDNMKEMYSFSKNIIQRVKKTYSLNGKLLLTWGASLGGLVLPLDQFIKTNNFSLDDTQTALVLVGVGAALFFENKKYFDRIFEEIKKQGLEAPFKSVLSKGIKLRNAFVKFIKSLNAGLTSTSEIISYGFLVPIVSDVLDFLQTGDLERNLALITKRIVASGLVTIAPEILKEILKKIQKKISN